MRKVVACVLSFFVVMSGLASENIIEGSLIVVPETPSGISAISTETTITISWSVVQNAISYDIFFEGVSVNIVGTTHTFIELEPGTSYTYKIRSVGDGNTSDYSNENSISTSEVSVPKVPDVPSEISASSGETSITVSWTGDENATSYTLNMDEQTVTTASTTYVFNDLIPSTEYRIKILATNAAGSSSYSTTEIIKTKSAIPSIPTGVSAVATEKSVTVRWPIVARAESYDVEFDGKIFNMTSTVYTFKELKTDTEYGIRVRSKNSVGVSEFSQIIKVKTLEEITGTPQIITTSTNSRSQGLPSVPQKITAQATEKSVTISWDMVTNATTYDVSIDGIVKNTSLTSFTMTDLKPDTVYSYKVRSRNSEGVSSFSVNYEIKTQQATQTVLDIPEQVNARLDNQKIIITWISVKNAQIYDVNINGNIQTTQSNTWIIENPSPDTVYEYSVRAKNSEGSSAYSPIKTMSTKGIVPNSPGNIRGMVTDSSLVLSWDSVLSASDYDIELNGKLRNTTLTTINFIDLIPNTFYTVKLRSRNKFGVSDFSKEVQFQTHNVLPTTPTINRAMTNATSITLFWSSVKAATTYEINMNGRIYTTTRTTFTLTNLEPNTEYNYSIRAKNALGNSSYSSLKAIKTTKLVVEIQMSLFLDNEQLHLGPEENFVLEWEPVDSASYYIVQIINDIDGAIVSESKLQDTTIAIDSSLLSINQYRIGIRAFDNEDSIVGNTSRVVNINKSLGNILPNTQIINLEDEVIFYVTFDEISREDVEYRISLVDVMTNEILFETISKVNSVTIDAKIFKQGVVNCRMTILAYDLEVLIAQSSVDYEIRGKSLQLDQPEIQRTTLAAKIMENEPFGLYWEYKGAIEPDYYRVNVYKNDLLYFFEENIVDDNRDHKMFYLIAGDILAEGGGYIVEVIAYKEAYKASESDRVYLNVLNKDTAQISTHMYSVNIDNNQVLFKGEYNGVVNERIKNVGFLWGNHVEKMMESTVDFLNKEGEFILKVPSLNNNTKYYYRGYVDFIDGTRVEGNIISFIYREKNLKILPEIMTVSSLQSQETYTRTSDESSHLRDIASITYTIATNNETEALLFINSLGISVVYKDSFEVFGNKRIWTLTRTMRKSGAYQEKVYGCNGMYRSNPYTIDFLIMSDPMKSQEITLISEEIPKALNNSAKIVFDGIDREFYLFSESDRLIVEGNVYTSKELHIKEVNFILDETIKRVYRKSWLMNDKLTELTFSEELKVNMRSEIGSKPLYIYVELNDGTVDIYKTMIVRAKVAIENKAYLTVGESMDLRLYAQVDGRNSQSITEKVVFSTESAEHISISGNTLTALSPGTIAINGYYHVNGVEGHIDTTIIVHKKLGEFEKTIYDTMKAIDQNRFNSENVDRIDPVNCTTKDSLRTIDTSGSGYCALATVANAYSLTENLNPHDILVDKRANNTLYSTYFDCESETVGELFSDYLFDKEISNVTRLKHTSFVESGLLNRIVDTIMNDKPIIALMAGSNIKKGSCDIFTQTFHYVIINGVKVVDGKMFIHIVESDFDNFELDSRLARWKQGEIGVAWVPIGYILSDIYELNIVN